MRKLFLPLLAGLTALPLTAALGADANAVETVVVTGSLENEIPQLLSRNGTQVDVIAAKAIKNGSYVDISQTLAAEAPGLYISSQHGPFDYVDVSLLGSRTADVLWLVDGVRIDNRLYAGTTPLDSIPASMVERIEVIQGGESLFYGTQAVAGAVNIITKSFSSTPDGAVTIGGDTNYGAHADGYFRDGFGRSKFVVYGSADISPGFRPIPEGEFQPSETLRMRGYHVFSGGGKYQFAATDDLTFTASYEKNIAHLEYPSPQDVNTAFNQRSEDLVTAKIDYAPSDDVQLFVKGYYHWWISHYTEFDNDPAGGLDIEDDHDHWGYVDRGVNAMAKIGLLPGLSSVVGYDYQNYNGNDAVLVIAPQSEEAHAVFGQIEAADLIPNAHLAVGVRYNMPSVGESAFVWNVSGQYDVSDMLYVKGMAGTSFRLPTAEELFANDPDDERGNPGLRPERSIGFNGSVGGHFDLGVPVDWHVTGFYREIKDLIDYATFDPATDQDVFGNVDGKVITRGFEAYASAPIRDDLSGTADFTYAAARETGSSAQFNRIPETVFKLGLDYHPQDLPFGASLTLQHVGDLQDTIGGGVGRIGYGDYTVLDIGTRVFLDDEHRHRIGLNLDNAFDEAYAAHLGRGTDDVTGDSYVVHDRGMPRTLYFNYTFSLQ
ncbi:MAG: TonB-dependent receptor [Rhizomicrobium sp.]